MSTEEDDGQIIIYIQLRLLPTSASLWPNRESFSMHLFINMLTFNMTLNYVDYGSVCYLCLEGKKL